MERKQANLNITKMGLRQELYINENKINYIFFKQGNYVKDTIKLGRE